MQRANSDFLVQMARSQDKLSLTSDEFYEFCPEFWKFLFSTLKFEVLANSTLLLRPKTLLVHS